MSNERFLADAQERGLEVEVIERAAANSLQEAAEILGIQPGDIVKSLVVKHKNGSFLFALIPGDRQISWPKLRELIGVNKLSMPSADVALEATGYERGTITPIGARGTGRSTLTNQSAANGSRWAPGLTVAAPSCTRMP